jgi:TRAP-type C4-dicarboxylate transport system permease small subunit
MTTAAAPAAPSGVAALLRNWHRVECLIAVLAFGFIAAVLILDVLGRELLGPLFRLMDHRAPSGVYASQKMSIYALVIGSFAGIGIATATGSHLLPRIGFKWVPQAFGPTMDRISDIVTGLFMLGVAWYGWVYVSSSMGADLRMQAFNAPIWPVQLAIPLGFLSAGLRYFFYAAWPAERPALPEFQE